MLSKICNGLHIEWPMVEGCVLQHIYMEQDSVHTKQCEMCRSFIVHSEVTKTLSMEKAAFKSDLK